MNTTPTTTSGDASRLPSGEILDRLGEQAALYERLEFIATKQRAAVAGNQNDALLAMLAARQEVSNRLLTLGQALAPVRRDWAAHRERMTADQRQSAQTLLDRTAGHLRRVIDRDEEDARLLSARKLLVQNMLQSTHATTQALSAYRVPRRRTARLNHVDEAT